MTFQPHPALRTAPGFPLGAVLSFGLVLAIIAALVATAAAGIGLVEW